MSYELRFTPEATHAFGKLRQAAEQAHHRRTTTPGRATVKSSKQEGLFKQVAKAVRLLAENPRHPGLNTHQFESITNPFDPAGKVFEAYAQNRTPGAYRIFWCHGPRHGEITIIAITPHP